MKRTGFFLCRECGFGSHTWLGRCPDCGSWNSLVEHNPDRDSAPAVVQEPLPLDKIVYGKDSHIPCKIDEIARVLGGCIHRGSTILFGGEPGIGKSTLMLQIADSIDGEVLYFSGEENPEQVKKRAERIGIKTFESIKLSHEHNLETIIRFTEKLRPALLIIDSIQTVYENEINRNSLSIHQLKNVCSLLVDCAKKNECAVLMIAHVTKEGAIAGPKAIEHLVDTVVYFESADGPLLTLRSTKNRFGSIDECGFFTMDSSGLHPVKERTFFMEKRSNPLPPGIVFVPVVEGSRNIMVEIQSLVVPMKSSLSRIYSEKIDNNRISRIAAVLERNLSIPFTNQDIYVNVARGIKLRETGIDLPIALAVYSSKTELPVPGDICCAGEISLAGEIRTVPEISRRLKAAADSGFSMMFGGKPGHLPKELKEKYRSVSTVKEFIQQVFKNSSFRTVK